MKVQNINPRFSEEGFAELVNLMNTFIRSVGLENMQGQILENILLPAGQSVRVSHSLKVTPKYRIILRQNGGGAIIDGDDLWTDRDVSLKNDGGSDATVSLFLIRS